MTAFLSAGSNIEPEINISRAVDILLSKGIQFLSLSTHFRTKPLKNKNQPSYVNGVWQIAGFDGDFNELRDFLHDIEKRCGRVRTDDPFSSRTLDLDIILTGDYASEDILKRKFIYIPLLEINPDIMIPGQGKLMDLIDDISIRERMHPLPELTEKLRRMIHEQ